MIDETADNRPHPFIMQERSRVLIKLPFTWNERERERERKRERRGGRKGEDGEEKTESNHLKLGQ